MKSIFERHPKTTLMGIVFAFSLICLLLAEKFASHFGLGKTVVYDAHPIYGYRPQPNQIVARQPTQVIKINNLGLRAEQDWEPSQYQHRILFLGDSVTYGGSYIANQDLFSHLAVKHLPQYVSGNAGVNGWGVNNVHALIKEMTFLPAQIYVSVFPEGDFYRGHMRIGGQPFWTSKPRYALEELFQYIVYKIHLQKNSHFHFLLLTDAEKTQIAEIAVRNLKDLDLYLKANHREHLIYITPSRQEVLGEATEDKVLMALFAKYDLKVIYLKDKLEQLKLSDKAQFFHDDIHLSKEGHQIWGSMIASDLQELISINRNS